MSKAIMDPEEVRRFAEELKRFGGDLESRLAALQSRFNALGNTWQDDEHEKFAAEFTPTIKTLRKFIEAAGTHSGHLLRKARRIEEYLQQR